MSKILVFGHMDTACAAMDDLLAVVDTATFPLTDESGLATAERFGELLAHIDPGLDLVRLHVVHLDEQGTPKFYEEWLRGHGTQIDPFLEQGRPVVRGRGNYFCGQASVCHVAKTTVKFF